MPSQEATLMTLILRAARFASMVHKGQARKYTNRPFIEHPMRVAMRHAAQLVATEDGVAAAWLHDTQEDCGVSGEQLRALFGEDVALLVDWLTNPSKGSNLPRAERKAIDRQHAKDAPVEVKVIKLIDRIDNLGEIDAADDFTALYCQESTLLVDAIGDADQALKSELFELIKHVEREYRFLKEQ